MVPIEFRWSDSNSHCQHEEPVNIWPFHCRQRLYTGEELAAGARFCKIYIITALFDFVPMLLDPSLAFAFALSTLNATAKFTSTNTCHPDGTMNIRQSTFSFDDKVQASSNDAPVKIAFLSTRHPHIMYRFAFLEKMGGFEFTGSYEVEEISTRLVVEIPKLKRFTNATALLDTNLDVIMFHSLDPDVPKWARFDINHPTPFKGLFSKKPGAAIPEDFVNLAQEIESKRPGLAVELVYEIYYSEAMEFAREVVK